MTCEAIHLEVYSPEPSTACTWIVQRMELANHSKNSLGTDRWRQGARAGAGMAGVARALVGARGRAPRPRPAAATHAHETVHATGQAAAAVY